MISSLRIGGLASGIDTDSIMKDLMSAHRIPLQKLQQERQILEWKQEFYREINTSLRTFRDTAFNLRLQGTFMTKTAASSNEGAVTAKANNSAYPGSYTVTVHNLATGVSKGSQSALADERDEEGNIKTLAQQFWGDNAPEEISFTLTGFKGGEEKSETFTFDTETKTIFEVVAWINNADLGIKAGYDADMNRFFLSTESVGAQQQILVENDENHFLSSNDNGNSLLQLNLQTDVAANGEDAEFDFGDVVGIKSAFNTVTVNGITLDLKGGTADEPATSTITVANDNEAVFNTIVDFVDKYNALMDTISNKLYEKRYPDYPPLTDEKREQLTDDQIEKWTEKARSGLLRYDSILTDVYNRLGTNMSSVVSGVSGGYTEGGKNVKTDSLAKIGINTTADYMSAKLEINEDQLRKAIEKDPQGIIDLFTKSAGEEDASDNELGIARRLYDNVNYGINRLMEKAGNASDFKLVDESVIGEEISDIDDRIETTERRLQQMEDRYWRQFTAMEQAIQQLNSQSMWLMQQFGMNG